ncbi:MAG: RagB/SusD family nutrient uptake outer membrane protein [Odoribacteraceae bacterium]|jgi:hypothetical protein|nr:RagB/SusD family nutrient uptake outer membrane protein [Odoribacteraceae bacterium]
MKRYKLLAYMLTFFLFGCNDWLDVSPRQEMKQEDLYKTEDGFKNSLMGVYIQIAGANLYGREVSVLFTDFLAQLWEPATGTGIFNRLPNWQFTDSNVEQMTERIWKAYYTAIVQLNDILENIDARKAIFKNNNYEIIKGEALGLRAFLHLDLLRLFGPIPGDDAIGKLAIPYAEEKTKNPNKLVTLSYKSVISKIIRDLDAAEKLLENVDPLITSTNHHLNNPTITYLDGWIPPLDLWQTSRQVRFNYYAVIGTKARYYHWIGDKENAVLCAKRVIESGKFRLTSGEDYTTDNTDYGKNLVMLSEHLFGVHNPAHQGVVQPYFLINGAPLSGNIANITMYVYETNTSEIRNIPNRYWTTRAYTTGSFNHFLKYGGNDNFPDVNKIPVLRLCEMYFIVVEDAPLGEIATYYNEYVDARVLPIGYKNELTDETAVINRLAKEYRKEFFGEGQTFFFYKKHRYTSIPRATAPGSFAVPGDYQHYEIPRPKSQTVFD